MKEGLLLARNSRRYGYSIFTTIVALSVFGVVNGDCTLGRTQDLMGNTVGYLNPGLIIDRDNPAACSGQITAWNVCYYNPRSFILPSVSSLPISLQIWRFNTPPRGVRVGAYARTLAIPASPPSFRCITIQLSPNDYMDVIAGDVIGVVTTATAVLPVVGNSNGVRLLISQSAPASVNTGTLTVLNNMALHVTAEIVQVQATTAPIPTQQPVLTTTLTQQTVDTSTTTEPTTTQQIVDTSTTTEQRPTTAVTPPSQPQTITTSSVGTSEETTSAAIITTPCTVDVPVGTSNETTSAMPCIVDVEPSPGLGIGGVLAIVFVFIIAVVVVVVIIIFVLIFMQRRKKASHSVTFSDGIDNAVYSVETKMNTILSTPGKPSLEGVYETSTGRFSESVLKTHDTCLESNICGIELIYEDVNIVEFEGYAVPQALEYEECLHEAKQGSMSRVGEAPYQTPADTEAAIYAELKKLKIRTIAGNRIEIGNKIGSGQFGTVSEGVWNASTSQSIPIAIKTLDGKTESDKIKFFQEVVIMGQFRHPNVVRLYGVAKKDSRRMMIVELLPKGDLHNHLRAIKPTPGELVQPFTPQLLLEFSRQIALGMGYLADRGFVHRDLAARNILISENNICKIADFGMSRDLQDADYYVSSGGLIPVRWTAPEAVHFKKYSTASDIWSYGCVLYEIWSLGTKPFEGIGNVEVIRILKSGLRLAPPPGCPIRVYEYMIRTWTSVPNDRPEFREILLGLLENKSVVLMIPPEDKATHPQAGVLGAPLEAGQRMYSALQKTYNSKST